MITNFQLACLLLYAVAGAIIVTDPVVAFVISVIPTIIDRVVFSRWYLICTHPWIFAAHIVAFPERATKFYINLSESLFEKFPELTNWVENNEDLN